MPQYQSYSHGYGTTGVAARGTPSVPRTSPCAQTVAYPDDVQSARAGGGSTTTVPNGANAKAKPVIR